MRASVTFLAFLALAACSDDPADVATIDGGPGPYDDCPDSPGPAAGDGPRFDTGPELGSTSSIHLTTRRFDSSEPGLHVLNAYLRIQPLPVSYTLASTDGNCRRWVEPGYNCGLGLCTSDQLCVGPDTCADAPAGADAGALELRLGNTSVPVPAGEVPGLYSVELETPGESCETVSITGEDLMLTTTRPPPLQLLGQPAFEAGQPLTIRWLPAETSSRVRVTLRADRGGHGFLYVSVLECDAPDAAGQVTIPAALVDAHLEEFSCGECPVSSITRYHREGDADLALFVEEERLLYLTPFSSKPISR